jgi:hypothetical protein
MVAAADQQGPEPEQGSEAAVLAERRARRAELAEGELRGRLADAEQRVAQLEHATHEAGLLRDRLAARAERDSRMAALVADAAATLREAREALDREIAARSVAEAALHAERAAREAAEQAVLAERAARDAATSALTAERARSTLTRPGTPATPAPAAPEPPPEPAPATTPRDAGGPDNEQLIAGLALAAERLRAQVEQADEPAAAEAPAGGAQSPAATPRADPPAPAADTPAERPESQPATAVPEPWTPRPGGLVERLGRALTRRR